MTTNFERVGEFLRKFDLPCYEDGEVPHVLDDERFLFRYELIVEECHELLSAHRSGDVLKVADALADLLYVVYGLGHYMHLPLDRVFEIVHEANMRKERAKTAAESKRGSSLDLVKPEGWKPPDLSEIL
jgi:predicted HAD superfamily Cof-like phosphohydrolase